MYIKVTLSSFLSKIGILSVLESNKIVFGEGAPTPLEELTALLQIRWSTGIDCDTLYHRSRFHSSRRLRHDPVGVLVKGGPKSENYGGSLLGFGVQKSPVGPKTKPWQGSEDRVGG